MAGEKNCVLVHGFLGSRIVIAEGSTKGTEVWCQPDYLKAVGPGILQLADNGLDPGPLGNGVKVEIADGIPTWSTLAPLADRLESEGWKVDPFNYDWRGDLETAAAALADYLIGKYRGQDFYVIGYSMGGLVARLAWPTFAAAQSSAAWKRTVFMAVPQYGSHGSALALANPLVNVPFQGLSLSNFYNPLAISKSLSRWLKVRQQLAQVVASWPSLYQLLPSIDAPFNHQPGSDGLLWNPATYASTNSHVKPAWFTLAEATRKKIDAVNNVGQFNSRTVQGVDKPTLAVYKDTTNPGDPDSYSDDTGDGIVVASRSYYTFTDVKLTLDPPDHREIPADGRTLRRITGLLLDPDFTALTVAPPFQGDTIPNPVPPPFQSELPILPLVGLQRRGDP